MSFLLQHHHRRKWWCIVVIFFFSSIEKKVMATSYCHLFRCNIVEEDDYTLPSSYSSETQRRQNMQENNKKKPREGKEITLKLLLHPFIFGSHFCPLPFTFLFLSFCFKCFFLATTSALPLLAPSFAISL
jgi:hypothetical protein